MSLCHSQRTCGVLESSPICCESRSSFSAHTETQPVQFLTSVLFLMSRLSGLSPFLGDDDNETLNNILACEWNFEEEEFKDVSDEAKDFITRLLVKSKSWRMSATESLKHPWLSDRSLHYQLNRKVNTKFTLPQSLLYSKQWIIQNTILKMLLFISKMHLKYKRSKVY